MLFNSYEFLLAFLPLTVAGFFLLGRFNRERTAIVWLVGASLFFYGWWNPPYLILLTGSICFNFPVGRWLYHASQSASTGLRVRQVILALGVAANLAAIGYFKYANFFVENLNQVAGTDYHLGKIILPLAISFFTFQQITYLVDSHRGITTEHSFLHYWLFVAFFPQLIAGPIVHHSEMLPQFRRRRTFRFDHTNLAIGFTILVIGLFKKAVLADGIAVYATPVFSAADAGASPDLLQAWGGALAYTFQLYFDFSGYSDMAIGGARIFGIRLPLNFAAPYKATNIIEFWRRWHMTLSRFLRDYVYIPLGGNRKGESRRQVNIMATMLLGGLWHGAGWTFIAWGGLHGIYLVINHAWHALRRRLNGGVMPESTAWGRAAAFLLTFLAVVVAWVFFRAESFDGALRILRGMAGLNDITLPAALAYRLGPVAEAFSMAGVQFVPGGGSVFVLTWAWILALFAIALLAPTTQQFLEHHEPALNYAPAGAVGEGTGERTMLLARRLRWQMSPRWALVSGAVAGAGILALPQVSEFLYFQF